MRSPFLPQEPKDNEMGSYSIIGLAALVPALFLAGIMWYLLYRRHRPNGRAHTPLPDQGAAREVSTRNGAEPFEDTGRILELEEAHASALLERLTHEATGATR